MYAQEAHKQVTENATLWVAFFCLNFIIYIY